MQNISYIKLNYIKLVLSEAKPKAKILNEGGGGYKRVKIRGQDEYRQDRVVTCFLHDTYLQINTLQLNTLQQNTIEKSEEINEK